MEKEVFTEYKAEKFLKKNFPIAKSQLVKEVSEIKTKKFPVVLKIISPGALHKSNIKGVRIVNNKEELGKEFGDLLKIAKRKKLKLEGILVQEFIGGHQMIVGGKKDSVFGQTILFGAGGIFTEILRDVSIRACPITKKDAQEMIDEVKYSKVLKGYRGEKANIGKLVKFLVKFSKFMDSHKKIEELDINPLMVNKKEVKIVDVRIVFSK